MVFFLLLPCCLVDRSYAGRLRICAKPGCGFWQDCRREIFFSESSRALPIPTGLNIGTTALHELGSPVLEETGVRGNVLRLRNYEGGGGSTDYHTANVTAGTVVEFTGLVRSAGTATTTVLIRFRSASAEVGVINAEKERLLPNGFGLFQVKATVTATATNVRVGFETTTGSQYMDVAELRLEQLP